MKCPVYKSKAENILSEDNTLIRYCTNPNCDWQHPSPHKEMWESYNERIKHPTQKEIDNSR